MEYADSLCKVKREKGLMTAVQANKFKITRKEMTGTGISKLIPTDSFISTSNITHNMRILFHKAHLYKSIRFIFTCEKGLYSQSEWRTAISHVEECRSTTNQRQRKRVSMPITRASRANRTLLMN